MTTADFSRLIYRRFKKWRYLIIAAGLIIATVLALYAKNSPVTYTSKATIFPLSSTRDNVSTSSAISALLGVAEMKNFSEEVSINIVELAKSRSTAEAVAATAIPSMGNKTIAQLLFEDINDHLGWLESKEVKPATPQALIIWATKSLQEDLNASINKNNVLVLSYTGRSEAIVRVISVEFINKITQFYIDLKIEKAKRDYEFARYKADSLRRVMGAKDYQLIAIDNRTLFTDVTKLQYKVPTENIFADKQMVRSEYAQAVNNREVAAYKLQKETPVIKVLDKPEPPYERQKKSAILYGILGFFIGYILFTCLVISDIVLKYLKQEIVIAIIGKSSVTTTTATTTSTTATIS